MKSFARVNTIILCLFLIISGFSLQSTPPADSPQSAPSSSNLPLAAACALGGTLVAYGLYRWLSATSTWSSDVIKRETEELLRSIDLDKKYPIEWSQEPKITHNLPRKSATVEITAELLEHKWKVNDIKVTEAKNPKDLFIPGALRVIWY